MAPAGGAVEGGDDVVVLSTPAHLNINKISREVRSSAAARASGIRRLQALTEPSPAQLRRADLSTHNCLLSIDDDARFVSRLAALFPGLPLVANLRCGLWYTPNPDATAYFKARCAAHSHLWLRAAARR